MSLYDKFKTDPRLETEGVEIEYGTHDGEPIRFRLARAGGANTRYAKVSAQRLQPYRRQLQTNTMDEEVAERLMREIFVDTVLLGWSNVYNEDGEHMVYNRENALKLLTDLPDLYADLRNASVELANYLRQTQEIDSGN